MLHSRSSVEAGQAMARDLPAARYIQADLSLEEQRRSLVEQTLRECGRIDLLVNNAGISEVIAHNDLLAATPEIWQRMHEVNVVAPFRLVAHARAALEASAKLRGRPACVINISSHAGVRPKGASIPYSAGKAALNHMTRLLALSLAPDIRVNAVAPGLVETPLTESWATARALWTEKSPMRRGAQPQDIAQVVALLADSDYLTGEVIVSDGGLNLT